MTQNITENTSIKTSDVQNECTLNKEEQQQEKMFTQSQLEEIIRERLVRERKVNESLLSVKQLLKSASEKGLLSGSSYSEMANELIGKLRMTQKNDGSSEGTAESEQQTMLSQTCAAADADGKEEVVMTEGKEKESTAANSNLSFIEVLSDIKAKYPRTAVEKMLSGNNFERFAKGRNGSISEIFDDYYAFVTGFSDSQSREDTSNGHSELASTAFSSHSGAVEEASNLTKQQMDIAKSAGMSYREYAHLLESIPKRTGRTI